MNTCRLLTFSCILRMMTCMGILLIILNVAFSFQIISPMELALSPDAIIQPTINAFGIPYSLSKCNTFRVVVSNPLDACTSLHTKEMIPPQTQMFSYHEDASIPEEDEEPLAILIQRGTCNFVQKVRMAEKYGFYNVILWNHSDENKPMILSDDGTGMMIRSRIVMIPKRLGKKIVDWIQVNPEVPVRVRLGTCPNHSYY